VENSKFEIRNWKKSDSSIRLLPRKARRKAAASPSAGSMDEGSTFTVILPKGVPGGDGKTALS
jgi:hypothetical protein